MPRRGCTSARRSTARSPPGRPRGAGWQDKTSRDPAVIRKWFPDSSDRGVFLHCGRSGLVVLDVDKPENLHPLIAQAVVEY